MFPFPYIDAITHWLWPDPTSDTVPYDAESEVQYTMAHLNLNNPVSIVGGRNLETPQIAAHCLSRQANAVHTVRPAEHKYQDIISSVKYQEVSAPESDNISHTLCYLQLQDEHELLPRMKIQLYPFQLMGVAWLRRQETIEGGGVLADEMGLGKTIQAIATICLDSPLNTQNKTLIIVPASLCEQWSHEIITKTDGSLRISLWHGTRRWGNLHEFSAAHVIITSYETLRAEWTNPEDNNEQEDLLTSGHAATPLGLLLLDGESGEKRIQLRGTQTRASPLFTTKWHRLLLDEAHNIRNRETVTARAVQSLHAKLTDFLTGNVLVNSLADCFPMCKILNHPLLSDANNFDDLITRWEKGDPSRAASKLRQLFIQPYVLRRTKFSVLRGKRLLDLPPKRIETHMLAFSVEEQRAYDGIKVKRGTRLETNTFYLPDSNLKRITSPFVLLLRWRQFCIHPYLIQEKTAEESLLDKNTYTEFSKLTTDSGLKDVQNCEFCADPLDTESNLSGLETNGVKLNPCGHLFCNTCLADYAEEARGRLELTASDKAGDRLPLSCPLCGMQTELPKAAGKQSQMESGNAGPSLLENLPKPFIPSTKLKFMMDLLIKWRDDPDTTHDKTLILSQLTSALDLAAIYLKEEGFAFVRYYGGTSREVRAKDVRTFMTDDKTPIMLLSMKAGGFGLNLTRANRVILLEPWWNVAVEDQAFSRCHRIGQRKPVFIHRLVIKGSIEERMLTEYQARKKALADMALDEMD